MFSVSSLRNRLPPALQESFDRMKGSILEALAHRMPPEDAEIMIKHWESLIPGRKSIEQHSSPTANNNHNSIEDFSHTELDKKIEETDKNITTWAVPQNSKDICLLHPVFGKLLVDLGYKRTYLTNAISLARAPIWEKQRILRHERATRIAQTKIDSKRPNLMVGTITMFNDLQGKYGIIDGQHRAAAYLIMAQRGFIDQMERNIVVDVIETNSNEDISSIFKEINSAEPVRLIDMPDEGASNSVRLLIDMAMDNLMKRFPTFFKESQRCRPPNVNIDILRDKIFQSDLLTSKNISSSGELIELINIANMNYSKLSDLDLEKRIITAGNFQSKGPMLKQAIAKAKEHSFFLGIDDNWLK